jgi:hypothetical protein
LAAKQSLFDLNPEAGTHPIPEDPAELAAALLAAERALLRMPYFVLRYGERGRRFTRSDSAWLVTLAAQGQPAVDRQVAWLASVLAARGMPSWTLQVHLELLYEALLPAVPARGGDHQRLLAAARRLAEKRQALIPDASITSLERALEPALDPDPAKRLPETAWLLASALADERDGLKNAEASLLPWLQDRARFSGPFVDGVQETLRQLRLIVHARR